ncbi:hypothetical protein AJGP001_12990 [Planococcus faecalis]|uniref:Uncharacterized protein n=1 Tax=Planococcus faecalis TaxID=1598147 RepID=A0ABM6IUA9_9BACL|nr:hypothetical protein AJGP001_12990 [Planococcus faecalis]OHX52582.1 hypothetical protein BB777_03505 [Planococcus faecalis]
MADAKLWQIVCSVLQKAIDRSGEFTSEISKKCTTTSIMWASTQKTDQEKMSFFLVRFRLER